MAEIPQPDDSGSSGTQKPTSAEVLSIDKVSPLDGLPIAAAVEGLATTRSKSLGGEVAASLLAGSFTQLSYDLQRTRKQLDEAYNRLDEAERELSDAKTRVAVLEERVQSLSRERHRKNVSIASGMLLVSIGIELSRNNLASYGIILIILGVLLVLNIDELSLLGVYDRGVPNEERLVIYANETVNLGQYGIMIGVRLADGTAFPLSGGCGRHSTTGHVRSPPRSCARGVTALTISDIVDTSKLISRRASRAESLRRI